MFGVILKALISYYDINKLYYEILDSIVILLIVVGGAIFGAALSQVWAERDKKKDES